MQNTYAITSNFAGAEAFGVSRKNILTFSEATGGRFSIWSPINLLFLIQLGEQFIEEFYLGGREADESLLNARTNSCKCLYVCPRHSTQQYFGQ